MESLLTNLYCLLLRAQYILLAGPGGVARVASATGSGAGAGSSLEGAVKGISYNENTTGFAGLASDVGTISSGVYTIVAKVGIACGIIGVVVCGIMFIYNSGGQGRQENKSRLVNTILGVIFVACAIGLVAALVKLGGQLFSTT